MSGQNTTQALGCRISLTSNSEIRYEGFLFAINEQENTVSLMNVRMFGTEGRRESPSEEVPPGECLYEHLVFSGADIKNLTVYEEAPLPKDPAILSGKAASTSSGSISDPVHGVGASSSQAHKKSTNYESSLRQANGTHDEGARGPHPHGYGRGNGNAPPSRPPRRRNEDGYGYHHGGYTPQPHGSSYYEHASPNQSRSMQQHPANSRGNAPTSGRGGRGNYEHRSGRGESHVMNTRGGYYEHHRSTYNAGGNPNHVGNSNHDGVGNNNRRGGGYRRRRGGNPGGSAPTSGAPHRRRDRAHTGQDFEVAKDATAARAEFEGDFDFECNNKKLVIEAKESTGTTNKNENNTNGKSDEQAHVQRGYDKTSSFFDTISCETRDKRGGGPVTEGRGGRAPREDREVAHKIDLETFGTELVQSQRRDGGHNGVRRGYVRRR